MCQSGPQHVAKLSHLQSVLPRGDSVGRTALRIFNLSAKLEDDLVVAGWSDACQPSGPWVYERPHDRYVSRKHAEQFRDL